jgi:hypothetical protein
MDAMNDDAAVDLDGDNGATGFGERGRERTEPRADFDDDVTRRHSGQTGDASHGVGVDHEVLAECSARRQAVALEKGRGLRTAECHQLTVTGSGASTRFAICK